MRSDTRGILYPFKEDPANPGATRMVQEGELMRMKMSEEQLDKKKILHQEGVKAVLLQDILSSISPTTIILKIDIEGYECKVDALIDQLFQLLLQALQVPILLGETDKFIPVIFVEWDKVVRCETFIPLLFHRIPNRMIFWNLFCIFKNLLYL